MRNEEAIYIKYMESLKQKLIAKYDELGLRASGKFAEELEYEVKGNKLRMTGASHSWFMENGRKSGGFPPIKAIEEWIEVKQNLPSEFKENKRQFAFIIARKIAKEGIKVPNKYNEGDVISDVVESFLANDLYDMIEELGGLFLARIQSDVIQLMQDIAA